MTSLAPQVPVRTDPLTGAVVVVTGASSGIGAAVARALVEAGAAVVGVDTSAPTVSGVDALQTDLRDPVASGEIVREVLHRHGRIDHLVNNAGLARHAPVADIDLAELDLMWQVNVRAVVQLTRDAMRAMTPPAGRGGRIVNVISTAALAGQPGESAYCATKFAVRGFTEAAAEEGRLVGVRVSGIYPAGVTTAFWDGAVGDRAGFTGDKQWLAPQAVASQVATLLRLPLDIDVPTLVVRHPGDADLDGMATKLARVRRPAVPPNADHGVGRRRTP